MRFFRVTVMKKMILAKAKALVDELDATEVTTERSISPWKSSPVNDVLCEEPDEGFWENYLYNKARMERDCLASNSLYHVEERHKRLNEWTSVDIMKWVCQKCQQANINYENIPIKNLIDMTMENFRHIDRQTLYKLFQSMDVTNLIYERRSELFRENLVTNTHGSCGSLFAWDTKEILVWMCNELHKCDLDHEDLPLENFREITIERLRRLTELDFTNLLNGNTRYAQILYEKKERLFSDCNNPSVNNKISVIQPVRQQSYKYPEVIASTVMAPRRRGRPRTKHLNENCKQDRKNPKLWEFLIKLLMDPTYCPSYIKWENFEEGTFKFVQNEQVAQMWGGRKHNKGMTFEKFSRAMRYYYSSKVLLPVPGKRLVYKFGPAAKGWKDKPPIL